MNAPSQEQRQVGSPTTGTALDLWVDLVSDIIVSEVLREHQVRATEGAIDFGQEETR